MAINPNREQARLTKTTDGCKAVIAFLLDTRAKIEALTGDLDQIQVRTQIQENGLRELQFQMKAFLEAEQTDDVKANVTRITDEMKQLQDALGVDAQAYSVKRAELDALVAKQAEFTNDPRMVVMRSQEAALKRKETSYPSKLKRHLLKARRHGWTDARLAGKKK